MVTRMLRRPRPCATALSAWRHFLSSRFAPLRRSPEGGQAVVELALVLPILLVVVLGIVDFGRAVNYWNDETHIANLAARYAAVGHLPMCKEKTMSTLVEFTRCEAAIDSPELEGGASGSTGAQGALEVCVSIPKPTVGEPVEVKVRTLYSWLPLPKIVGGKYTKFNSTTLSGSATMRLEQVPPTGFATTTSKCP